MKVNAIITPLDDFSYEIYFNDYIENFNIILYGNKDFKSFNDDIIKNIIESFENFEYIKQEFYNMNDFIKYYHLEKENNNNWSSKEKAIYKQLYNNYENNNYRLKNDDILEVLKIIKNKDIKSDVLSGYCQGEYINIFYDSKELKKNDIDMIESLYFGGCYEVIFTNDKIRNIENIYNKNYDSLLLSNNYNKSDIEKQIKEFYNNDKIKIDIYTAIEKQVIKYTYEKI